MGKIVQLQNKKTGENEYPRTYTKAVIDDKATPLDTLMQLQDEKIAELGSHGLYAYFNNYLKPTFSRTEGVLEITLPRQIRIYQYSGEIVVEKDLSTTQYTISVFKKLVINSKSKEVSVKDFTDKSDYDIVLIACVSGDRYTGLLYPYMIADTDSEIIGNLSSLKLDELINTRYTNGYLYGNTNVIDNCSIYQSGAFVSQKGYMVTADFIDVPKNRKILWVHGRTTQQSGIGCVAEYDSDGNFLSYWTMTGEKYRLFELYDENTTKIKATFIKGAHPIGLYEEDGTPLFIPVLDSVDERLNVLDGEIKSLQNVVVETDMFCKASWDNYSDEVFHLEAGVQYNVFFTPDKNVTNLANNESITDGYCNVKIADANTLDTLKKIHPIYKLEAGKTIDITYTPDEDIDVKVGCYTKNMSSDFKQGVIIKKVEKEDNVDVNNATDIVSYYSSNVIREQSNILKDSDFRCFFFSDVHDSATNVKRIFELANDFGDGRIDCIVNTGDTVSSVMNTGLEWYNSLVDKCNISILHAPGNHDCWKNSNWNWASGKDVYSFIIDKVVSSNVGIMQPSNAAANGLCYYYKDFGNVRVISILSIATSSSDYYFDDAQKEWLASVLESARTTYHYWKIQSNKPTAYSLKSGDVITATLVNDADLNNYQHTHYKEGEIYAVPMSVIIMNHCPFMKDKATRVQSNKINSWMDYTKGCFSKGVKFDALSLSNEAVSVVDNYIKNGGSFICWLTGHTHIDAVLTHSDSNKQLMININSAKYSNKEDGVPAESIAEPNYDSFDYIGVDLKSAQIKVLRMGYAEDSSMRVRRSWCYDYANSVLISEN